MEPLYLVLVVYSLAFSWCSLLSCGLGLQIFYLLLAPSKVNGTLSSCWGSCSTSLNISVYDVEVAGIVSSFLGTMGAHRVSCLVFYDFTTARKNTTNIFQLCTFEFLVSFYCPVSLCWMLLLICLIFPFIVICYYDDRLTMELKCREFWGKSLQLKNLRV